MEIKGSLETIFKDKVIVAQDCFCAFKYLNKNHESLNHLIIDNDLPGLRGIDFLPWVDINWENITPYICSSTNTQLKIQYPDIKCDFIDKSDIFSFISRLL